MTEEFPAFANAVRNRFMEMSENDLFTVNRDKGDIWDTYLSAFPPGTNPIFRERTEHDCSCCRHFIKSVGNVVAIENGAVSTIWDLNGLPNPYQHVADKMAKYVRRRKIGDVFLTKEKQFGAQMTPEYRDGTVHMWHHFSCEVSTRHFHRNPVERRGELRTTFEVLMRGLTELSTSSLETIADLIDNGSLYRGDEFKRQVNAFRELQRKFLSIEAGSRSPLVWQMINEPVARFRNTVMGTLAQDLSDGVDLEDAVKAYESKVAPQNYKRPTALITKGMVDDAMKTIHKLDLEPSLDRRHARLEDVSVNSVLFVDNSVRSRMKGGVEDLLLEEVKPRPFDQKKAEKVTIEKFISDVIPQSTNIQLFFENRHLSNLVSMTAPVHPDTHHLFKWNNDFAWSYEGNVTDSIKERVKRAGGEVEGVDLRVSLAWYNYDDLDIHVLEPNGNYIYFGHKCGKLDVDMNATSGTTREPVENVRWKNNLIDGVYAIKVNQYNRRERIDAGFEIEIESHLGMNAYRYEKAIPTGKDVPVCTIEVKNKRVINIVPAPHMIGGASSKEAWGLNTQELIRVNSIVLSPNYWDHNEVGNKHLFFILDGCNNPLPTRGIYNEFLSSKLEKHRKVFEVLGDKTKCPPSGNQMSGVGFSSTRRNEVTVLATGPNLSKAYTVAF